MSVFSCNDYRRLLSDVLDEADDPVAKKDRKAFDVHGAECPACLGHMKDAIVLRETLKGLAAVEEMEEAAAPALPEALVRKILEAAKTARESVRKKG